MYLRKVFSYLAAHGARATALYAVARLSEIWHERRIGIKTSGYVRAAALGISNPCASDYHATDYRTLFRVMKRLSTKTGTGVFLDYGSGMGRVVVVAAMYPFRKVLGVELSRTLNGIARSNLARARKHLRCRDVEVIEGNASDFPFPAEVTFVFLFNPFVGAVLQEVFEKIRVSVAQSPRQLTIVYKPPRGMVASALDEVDWLERSWIVKDFQGRPIIAYRTRAASGTVGR